MSLMMWSFLLVQKNTLAHGHDGQPDCGYKVGQNISEAVQVPESLVSEKSEQ
jgi:hypothetical protein